MGGFEAEGDDEDGVLEGLKGYAGEDCSFAAYVETLGLAEWEVAAEIGYVEGFNAADAREVSVVALGRPAGGRGCDRWGAELAGGGGV